jgi:hypothetical protein
MKQLVLNRKTTASRALAFVVLQLVAPIQPSPEAWTNIHAASGQLFTVQVRESVPEEAKTVRQFVESLEDLFALADGSVRAQRADELRKRVPEFQRSIESLIRRAKTAGMWNGEFDDEISTGLNNAPAIGVFFKASGGARAVLQKIATDQSAFQRAIDAASSGAWGNDHGGFNRALIFASNVAVQLAFCEVADANRAIDSYLKSVL